MACRQLYSTQPDSPSAGPNPHFQSLMDRLAVRRRGGFSPSTLGVKRLPLAPETPAYANARLGWLLAAACMLLAVPAPAWAGLGASEVVVVVNSGSLNSRTVANHFVALRGIPARNVIVLENVPNSEVITVDQFRETILNPLLAELDRRQLSSYVQCIAYSADFPTAINIASDLKQVADLNKLYTQKGSLTGLTYLYATVARKMPSYVLLEQNYYARRSLEAYFQNPAGVLTEEAWARIQQAIQDEQHSEASRLLEELFMEFQSDGQPYLFPVAYLAAAESAQAGEEERALDLLNRAINAGWMAGGYMAEDKRLDALRDNPDFQVLELLLDPSIREMQPPRGFDARTRWFPTGVPTSDPRGARYLMSVMLGVTRGPGTTLSQAVEILDRAASADFTHPDGKFYFSVTKDVRSQTRKWGFLTAGDELKLLGFESELIETTLPQRQPQVLGVQIGSPSFDWSQCGSQFVPGAIADNLTSLGGVMTPGSGQTKLTELLKAGAAGSSGTVTEPYALQAKFPTPHLYVYYAQGASLAEAFYLSVTGPYQLLIVGDPLCRPFSIAPQQSLPQEVAQLTDEEPLVLELDLGGTSYDQWLELEVTDKQKKLPLRPAAVALLLDGLHPKYVSASKRLDLTKIYQQELRGLAPGYHEFQVRLIAADPFNQRSESKLPFWVGERQAINLVAGGEASDTPSGATPELAIPASLREQTLVLRADAAGAERISLWHDSEQIGLSEGETAEFSVPLERIGLGPARLCVQAEVGSGQPVHSRPLWIEVGP